MRFIAFAAELPVSDLVSLLFLAFTSRSTAEAWCSGARWGIPHDHLERPVPEQFCDGAQIDSGHNQSTCKSMAVAMPRIPLNLRLFERAEKPAP